MYRLTELEEPKFRKREQEILRVRILATLIVLRFCSFQPGLARVGSDHNLTELWKPEM